MVGPGKLPEVRDMTPRIGRQGFVKFRDVVCASMVDQHSPAGGSFILYPGDQRGGKREIHEHSDDRATRERGVRVSCRVRERPEMELRHYSNVEGVRRSSRTRL